MKPENLRFTHIIIFILHFAFLIDIINNIITCSPNGPYFVIITSANGSALSLSRGIDGYHVTSKLHCHWLKYW